MKQELYGLILSLRHYARFLRTNNSEDAVKAVQHPKDRGKYKHQDYCKEEQEKAVEVCRDQNQGKVAFIRWVNKPTAYNRNMAFTVLKREQQPIPAKLFQAVLNDIDKQIDNYEEGHPDYDVDKFYESAWQFSMLKNALKKNTKPVGTKTKVQIFKEYAVKWEIPKTEKKEPWEVLQERYKTRKKRDTKEERDRIRRIGVT